MGRVVVMGSLHMDLMVAAPSLPRLGETLAGSAWSYRAGGKGGNQAVRAACHGAEVAMLGLVGADDFGLRLRCHLREHGVDDAGVAVCDGAPSGMSVALTEPGGDYAAVIVSGVNLLLDAPRLAPYRGCLTDAAWLLLQNEVPEAANAAAAAWARASGARVLLNAAPARPLSRELLNQVDVLVVNALEAEAMCGLAVIDLETAGRAAQRLADLVPCAIVTAGGAGVAMAQPGAAVLLLAGHAVRVVSTHGAGDAFVGVLAASLAEGEPLAAALRRANAAAALSVAAGEPARGTMARADIDQSLRDRPNAA